MKRIGFTPSTRKPREVSKRGTDLFSSGVLPTASDLAAADHEHDHELRARLPMGGCPALAHPTANSISPVTEYHTIRRNLVQAQAGCQYIPLPGHRAVNHDMTVFGLA